MIDFTPDQLDAAQNAITDAHTNIAALHPVARLPAALLAVNLFTTMLEFSLFELTEILHANTPE